MERSRKVKAHTRRLILETKTCPECGKEFQGVRLRVYCTQECRNRAIWKRKGEEYNANRKAVRDNRKGESDE